MGVCGLVTLRKLLGIYGGNKICLGSINFYNRTGLLSLILMHDHKLQLSLSKMLNEDDCDYSSRESTRQEFYQQLQKHKAELRKNNHDLRRDIETAKQRILSKALATHFNKLKQLNEANQQLRDKHRQIYQTKKPTIAPQIEQPKSPLLTPRSRRSGVNISQPSPIDNNFNKVNLYGRKSLNASSNNQNMRPKIWGRMSLKASDAPLRNDQHTERKMRSSIYLGDNRCNISTFSETQSMRNSVKSRVAETCSQNIFFQFINAMLQEEKEKEKEFNEVVEENTFYHRGHEEVFVDKLEAEAVKTSKNIEKLEKVMENYELEIKKMHINLDSVSEMAKELGKVKKGYLNMQQKCKDVEYLRVEVLTKEKKLKELKDTNKSELFEPPSSIQMILRLFGVEEASLTDPSKCKQQMRKLVKGSFEKPSKKRLKIKQLLDTMREGRKKFRQLMSVYEGRIKKLQRKLVSLRIQQGKGTEN